MSTFPATLAIDEAGVLAPVGSVGQVFAPSDTAATTPLAIFDLNGLPISGNELVANGYSVIQSFRYDGLLVVDWVSGDFRIPLTAGDQIPAGGTTGQVLGKASGTDYDTEWIDAPAGTGGGGAASFDELTGILDPDQSAVGAVMFVKKIGAIWPARPTGRADVMVIWVGDDPSPTIVDSGTGGMLNGTDQRSIPQ